MSSSFMIFSPVASAPLINPSSFSTQQILIIGTSSVSYAASVPRFFDLMPELAFINYHPCNIIVTLMCFQQNLDAGYYSHKIIYDFSIISPQDP